jgi:hypothetical protein
MYAVEHGVGDEHLVGFRGIAHASSDVDIDAKIVAAELAGPSPVDARRDPARGPRSLARAGATRRRGPRPPPGSRRRSRADRRTSRRPGGSGEAGGRPRGDGARCRCGRRWRAVGRRRHRRLAALREVGGPRNPWVAEDKGRLRARLARGR